MARAEHQATDLTRKQPYPLSIPETQTGSTLLCPHNGNYNVSY